MDLTHLSAPDAPLAIIGLGYVGLPLAVAHREFIAMGPAAIRALGKPKSVLFDVKSALPADQVDGRL